METETVKAVAEVSDFPAWLGLKAGSMARLLEASGL